MSRTTKKEIVEVLRRSALDGEDFLPDEYRILQKLNVQDIFALQGLLIRVQRKARPLNT